MTFDRIKMVAGIDTIVGFNEAYFEETVKDHGIFFRYHQEDPYLLVIKIDCKVNQLVVEFSGKILGEEYPKLVSLDNIHRCLLNINSLGFITLDIDKMMDSDIVACDVTKDIHYEDIPGLTCFIRNHISNYQSYKCCILRNKNLIIEKNVVSPKSKKRITIYDKGKEMEKARNRAFVDFYGLHNAFDGKCRFELNLNSKAQIRKALGITNTKIQTVLSSISNPILDYLKELIDVTCPSSKLTDMKQYKNWLVLKECGFDLEKVDAIHRQLYTSKGTSYKDLLKPYRLLVDQQFSNDICLWNHVCDLLAS